HRIRRDRRDDHRREQQHRGGEDHRDHARGVDLERDVGGLAAHHPPTTYTLGELDRDPTLALVDVDDGDDHRQEHRHHDREPHRQAEFDGVAPHLAEDEGELADDAHEDQERHAVSDTPLGDELTQPHDEGGAGRHRDDDQRHLTEGVLAHEVDPAREGSVVEQIGEGGRLDQRQDHRHVPGPLGDDLPARLPFVLERLQLGYHHGEQLHDDRGGDVGHDPQGEHGE